MDTCDLSNKVSLPAAFLSLGITGLAIQVLWLSDKTLVTVSLAFVIRLQVTHARLCHKISSLCLGRSRRRNGVVRSHKIWTWCYTTCFKVGLVVDN
jgi:hypothetical protein